LGIVIRETWWQAAIGTQSYDVAWRQLHSLRSTRVHHLTAQIEGQIVLIRGDATFPEAD